MSVVSSHQFCMLCSFLNIFYQTSEITSMTSKLKVNRTGVCDVTFCCLFTSNGQKSLQLCIKGHTFVYSYMWFYHCKAKWAGMGTVELDDSCCRKRRIKNHHFSVVVSLNGCAPKCGTVFVKDHAQCPHSMLDSHLET